MQNTYTCIAVLAGLEMLHVSIASRKSDPGITAIEINSQIGYVCFNGRWSSTPVCWGSEAAEASAERPALVFLLALPSLQGTAIPCQGLLLTANMARL